MVASFYKDFYFMRCFSCEKYRDDFNTGRMAYINSTEYFHNLEDEFQQDFEGGIFQQRPSDKGTLLFSKKALTSNEVVRQSSSCSSSSDTLVISTNAFRLYIKGYIFCVTTIPKHLLRIEGNAIVFNEKYNISDSFWHLLNQYTKQCDYTYISFYDAEPFIETFYRQLTNKGYSVNYGRVEYENLSPEQRIKHYSNNDVSKLIFTKSLQYEYQNEFRFFIHHPGDNHRDHLEITGIDMQCALLQNFVYLSPNYVNDNKLLN